MSTAIAFDTLAYTKKLKAAGVPESQAEVHAESMAELIEERLVTKQDLKELEMRLSHTLTIRLGGMMAASVAIVAALVTLL
ncbi:MAG: DUF1640 domain-containing protein [Nitrospirae bacterium]|nr:DUF1640 domain-containing protein [Magnetococcales bacterium]HAT49683.1 DUF1640 domain-containing protein [Alphaproteobacteria bacterium]